MVFDLKMNCYDGGNFQRSCRTRTGRKTGDSYVGKRTIRSGTSGYINTLHHDLEKGASIAVEEKVLVGECNETGHEPQKVHQE